MLSRRDIVFAHFEWEGASMMYGRENDLMSFMRNYLCELRLSGCRVVS